MIALKAVCILVIPRPHLVVLEDWQCAGQLCAILMYGEDFYRLVIMPRAVGQLYFV